VSKISELTDGGSLLPTDFLIAVRSGGNVKVKADQADFDRIRLGDNEKIELGNSQDLTMVHTSTQSIINQAGVGDLLIQKAGATKLTINASGIDVTGTVTADGLTVENSLSGATNLFNFQNTSNTANSNSRLKISTGGTSGGDPILQLTDNASNWYVFGDQSDSFKFKIGTSVTDNKFVMDSTGNAGLGTATPAEMLEIYNATSPAIQLNDGGAYQAIMRLAGNDLEIRGSSGSLEFYTGAADGDSSTQRMTIDTSGNLLVGVTSTTLTGGSLTLPNSGIIAFHDAGGAARNVLQFVSGNIKHGAAGGGVTTQSFYTSNSLASTIDASGNLLFSGATSNTTVLSMDTASGSDNKQLSLAGGGADSDGRGSRIRLFGNNHASLAGDADISTGNVAGAQMDLRAKSHIALSTNSDLAVTIDSSQNLLVGGTDTAPGAGDTNTGISFRAGGDAFFSKDSSYAARFNRNTNDGDLVTFAKDGTTVGSIGTEGGNLTIDGSTATGKTGIEFGGAEWYPRESGANSDGLTSLGGGSDRFKDLHLSGVSYNGDGSATVPSISFGADTNTGFYRVGSDKIGFVTAGSLGAVLDNSGNLLVGKSAVSFATAGIELKANNVISITRSAGTCINANRIGSSAGSLIIMHYDGVDVGSIDVTASATSYNTSSDQRLKENIADADDAGSKIDAIQVRKFDWKVDGSHQDYGMVAQELLEVAPEAVSQGETKEEMMAVDYSKLVPMMLKEIQSLRARIAALES